MNDFKYYQIKSLIIVGDLKQNFNKYISDIIIR